ncbi:MAG: DUF1302 domain-containing protein [Rhodocyclaceae bacterium]|nr:MAG: DUF1302 domain-containing protein [Rhodocyclaceae bacterium]
MSRQEGSRLRFRLSPIASAIVLTAFIPKAFAFSVDSADPDVSVRFDNTVKYSAAWRTSAVDSAVAAGPGTAVPNPNLDDGDRNFKKGLISNRFDLLSELDFSYKNQYGFRVSAAAWYDDVYNRGNDNDSAATNNNFSVGPNAFPNATKKLQGQDAEFLDAFVFGKFNVADSDVNVRVGRFTQLFGESLFFGGNGIAAAQSSMDIVKLVAVPSAQFKEILRPVGQVSGTVQLSPQFSVSAYYQYEWRKARLPAVGSYFSFADFADDGGERVIAGAPIVPGGGPAAFFRGTDLKAKNSGQGGIAFKYKVNDWEFGLYGARFHDKFPQFYFRPGVGGVNVATGRIGDYVLVYGEDIKVIGGSFSTLVGETNLGGEVSFRDNMPLQAVGNVVVDPTGTGNGGGNPLYPVGKTAHAQISAIQVMGASPLWQGASFLGELAFNRLLSITKNPSQLDPNVTRDAWAARFIFQPEYFEVIPQVNLQVPIGLGYGLKGSSAINGIGFPAHHGGDFSIGLKADYQKLWYGSLSYTQFLGDKGPVVDALGQLSGNQQLKDRNFISLSIQRTF